MNFFLPADVSMLVLHAKVYSTVSISMFKVFFLNGLLYTQRPLLLILILVCVIQVPQAHFQGFSVTVYWDCAGIFVLC